MRAFSSKAKKFSKIGYREVTLGKPFRQVFVKRIRENSSIIKKMPTAESLGLRVDPKFIPEKRIVGSLDVPGSSRDVSGYAIGRTAERIFHRHDGAKYVHMITHFQWDEGNLLLQRLPLERVQGKTGLVLIRSDLVPLEEAQKMLFSYSNISEEQESILYEPVVPEPLPWIKPELRQKFLRPQRPSRIQRLTFAA